MTDFSKLKKAIQQNEIDYKTARNIFGSFNIDSIYIEKSIVPITYFLWYRFSALGRTYPF